MTEKETGVPPLTDTEAAAALDAAVRQVRINLPQYTHHCQNHSSLCGVYPTCDNVQWTCGFWPGEIWLSYERTGEDAFRQAGNELADSFLQRIERKISVDHHDMGFLYTPSCVAAYRLTGNKSAKKAALLAADQLLSRFQPEGSYIQAWGEMNDPANRRMIVDSLLNMPLLYWATEETGLCGYADVAMRHTDTCMAHCFRPDGSTYHTYFFTANGRPDHGATCQGYRDDSYWARGQAWAIYGSILAYRYTGREEYLNAFRSAARFYLSHLPPDLVPYWDMIFTAGSEEPRDSSSAAIVACALLEAMRCVSDTTEAAGYQETARKILYSLVKNYAVQARKLGFGQLAHGTYSKKSPYNTCVQDGVDESTGWGDYYYMEALTRLTKQWNPYW